MPTDRAGERRPALPLRQQLDGPRERIRRRLAARCLASRDNHRHDALEPAAGQNHLDLVPERPDAMAMGHASLTASTQSRAPG